MEDITFSVTKSAKEASATLKDAVADFLFVSLDQYGDKREDILKCLHYALPENGEKPGGLVIHASVGQQIIGAVVINNTGMEGYIPENILVYIAIHADYRGKGLGKSLMNLAIENTTGNIALHVEPDNPARFLYQKLGFDQKYLEMRLYKK